MAEKVTVMVLKADLQCPCCYKQVKKILCKFPEIRDQIYNEKENIVTITVVCCDPEEIRDKLWCKGAKVIKCIEIKEPPKPEKPKKPKKSKDPKKPKEKPKEAPKCMPPKQCPPCPTPPPPVPIPVCFPPTIPRRTCCGPCSEGCGGGPCFHGCGVPPPPKPCYDGYYCYGYGYGRVHDRSCHPSRCDYYFSEENPQACSIM